MKEFLRLLFQWLSRVLPSFIAGFTVGYKVFAGRLNEAKLQIIELELKYNYEKNKNTVEEKYRDKSDSDILDDAIKSGAESEREREMSERRAIKESRGP